MRKLFRIISSLLARLTNNGGFAAVVGDNATLDQAGGPNQLIQGLKDARVKVCLESYTILGTEGAGDTLDLGAALPANAHVIGFIIHVSAAQTALTYQLGDDADADRYVATGDTSLATAGVHIQSGKNYKTGQASGDQQIVLTTEAATMTAGQLEVAILYSMD